jgi:hypothetical protein
MIPFKVLVLIISLKGLGIMPKSISLKIEKNK